MTDYYTTQLYHAKQYEQYVDKYFIRIGSGSLGIYTTREDQFKYGESKAGVEIKHDSYFRTTNNLWIECAERTDICFGWTKSGIYECHSRYYLIGDYTSSFIFPTLTLRSIEGDYQRRHNNMDTSIGFLLPLADIKHIQHRIVYYL
jgi:hypothetical protein